MTETTCGRCSRPADTPLCTRCQTGTRELLANSAWLDDQLHTRAYGGREYNTLTERALFGRRPETEDDEQSPVPWHIGAADARRRLHQTVRTEAHAHAARTRTRIAKISRSPQPITTGEYAAWLAANLPDIARLDHAPDFAEDLANAYDGGIMHIHRRTVPVFLGPCPTPAEDPGPDDPATCSENLWAPRDHNGNTPPTVRCWRCRTEHDAQTLKREAAGKAEHLLMTGAEILRILSAIDEHLPRATFYAWRRDRTIEPHAWQLRDGRITSIPDQAGAAPLFRFGQVRELATTHRRAKVVQR